MGFLRFLAKVAAEVIGNRYTAAESGIIAVHNFTSFFPLNPILTVHCHRLLQRPVNGYIAGTGAISLVAVHSGVKRRLSVCVRRQLGEGRGC